MFEYDKQTEIFRICIYLKKAKWSKLGISYAVTCFSINQCSVITDIDLILEIKEKVKIS